MENTMQLSRRGLFKLAGAGTLGVIGAGALAGCAPSASTGTNLSETGAEVNQHDYSNYETKEMEAYAVVAGGGAAGLLAAYTLAKAGKMIIAGRLPQRSTLSCHTVPRRAATC